MIFFMVLTPYFPHKIIWTFRDLFIYNRLINNKMSLGLPRSFGA